jgi:phosphatidylinositol alpha-mannosyltransferase
LAEGSFDVVHVHEPTAPSTSLLATFFADVPLVATFHAAVSRSLALSAAAPILQTALEKVSIRIAVSEAARDSLVNHLGGTAIVIPNGVDVRRYAASSAGPGWSPRTLSGQGRTIGFVGRLDDPRKGLAVLLDAFGRLATKDPDLRLLVVGPGDQREALRKVAPELHDRITFTGLVSDAAKIAALHAMDVYVAPNLGGESFGIVLTEAMASGAPVVASDIDAFLSVIGHGRAGQAFRTGDSADLARVIEPLLADGDLRRRLSRAAQEAVRQYDWTTVAADIVAVYDTVTRPQAGRLRTA